MFRIAEVAEMTGVPATAIRYYEAQGLLRPAERQANGYRTYGERDVARLQFVKRARALDLSVDALRELVDLWEDDACAEVAGRMRERVGQRLVDVHERIAALAALADELRQVEVRLQAGSPEGSCSAACVCLDRTPLPAGSPMEPRADACEDPIVCRLGPTAMTSRVDAWQRVLAHATDRVAVPDGLAIDLLIEGDLVADLVEVARAEQQCCPSFTFSLQITLDTLRLVVTAPPRHASIVAAMFGEPDQMPPNGHVGSPLTAPPQGDTTRGCPDRPATVRIPQDTAVETRDRCGPRL